MEEAGTRTGNHSGHLQGWPSKEGGGTRVATDVAWYSALRKRGCGALRGEGLGNLVGFLPSLWLPSAISQHRFPTPEWPSTNSKHSISVRITSDGPL